MNYPQASEPQQNNSALSYASPAPPRRLFFWAVAVALGFLQVWAHRNDVSPDGISYIEIAEAAARNGLHALVNGYWGPLYPFLVSFVFRAFHPSLYAESTAVHFVNFFLYLANLLCFEIFLCELISARARSSNVSGEFQPIPAKTLWTCGYLLFLWSCQFWLGPAMTNPDLCVAALVYLATALLLRIHRGKGGALLFILLGATLGVAYLAKAAMFLISFVFLLSGLFLESRRGSYRKAAAKTLLAFAVFTAIAAPLVIALSKEKHRATFGDSGKIAYAEYVNRATWLTHWQGDPPGTGIPLHPTRKMFSDPAVYEFSQPIPGSYPPWYDPSYWYDGIAPHFSLRGQLWVLFRAANAYLKLFSRSGALYVVFIALFVWVKKAGRWEFQAGELLWVFLPSPAALAMYSLVLVEQRYVSAFALMLLLWILASARISKQAGTTFQTCAAVAMILAPTLAVAWSASRDLKVLALNKPNEAHEVAAGLHEMGIPEGTDLGYIGSGLDAYWAHLAGMRIVAEIPEKDQHAFWSAAPARQQKICAKFAEAGVQALVTKNPAAATSPACWRQIRQTQFYVRRLSPSATDRDLR